MKKMVRRAGAMVLSVALALSVFYMVPADTKAADYVGVYRLNNILTGEHLYTTDQNEVETLGSFEFWENEGRFWNAPLEGTAVYRLNNPLGFHLYTSDENEINTLVEYGWQIDNNNRPMFYSGGDYEVYRLYNERGGFHLLTTDKNEYDILRVLDWTGEGTALFAASIPGMTSPSAPADPDAIPGSVEDILSNAATAPDASPAGSEVLNFLLEDIIGSITDSSMTQYEKVKACYDYLIENTDYGNGDLSPQQKEEAGEFFTLGEEMAYSCLVNHKGHCNDYSAAMILMLRYLGFEADMASGATSRAGGGYTGHYWTEAVIDGVTYIFDSDVEDNIARGGEVLYYRFCKTYDEIPEKYIPSVQKCQIMNSNVWTENRANALLDKIQASDPEEVTDEMIEELAKLLGCTVERIERTPEELRFALAKGEIIYEF